MDSPMFTINEHIAIMRMKKHAEEVAARKPRIIQKAELERLNEKLPIKEN